MRVAVASLMAAFTVGGSFVSAQTSTAAAACTFSLRDSTTGTPAILGEPDLVARFRTVSQADSPVDIGEIDLSRLRLSISGPSYVAQKGSEYAVVLRNRSDLPIYDVRGMLRVSIGSPVNGTGSGWIWKGILTPGQAVRVVTKSGAAMGSRADGEVFLSAAVDSVKFATCTYIPSQSYLSALK